MGNKTVNPRHIIEKGGHAIERFPSPLVTALMHAIFNSHIISSTPQSSPEVSQIILETVKKYLQRAFPKIDASPVKFAKPQKYILFHMS